MQRRLKLADDNVGTGAPVTVTDTAMVLPWDTGISPMKYSWYATNSLALVTNEIPVKINLVAPKVTLLQNGSLNLKVVAERKGDFKGPISLALLYNCSS